MFVIFLLMKFLVIILTLLGICKAQYDPNSNNQVMTHLFEWKWADIALECEQFLAPKGYGGVQVSPVSENVVIMEGGITRPWYERYQVVSYILTTRSGTVDDFIDMAQRCNNVGVRIYVDVVFNQMTGSFTSGTLGTAGTSFDYDGESYPGVPYSVFDFNDANCFTSSGSIENYQDKDQVKNCRLLGMCDLNQGTDYVRARISDFLNTLISYGVAGFRVDAAKHMWPGDLLIIFDGLNDLSTDFFSAGTRPFVFLEVIDQGGEPITASDYFSIGRVTEFKYGLDLSRSFKGNDLLKYLVNFGEDWGLMDRSYALVFIDNHDNQRGSGGGGDVLTFRDPRPYKMAVGFMLAHPYGYTRVMSSFYWAQNINNGQDSNSWQGPPHDSSYNTESPVFASDDSCSNDWMCEHRWRQIYNMVGFRDAVHGTDWNNWWDNGNNQISFCRGSLGFAAFNTDNYDLAQTLQTCLPTGTYCDVVSGSKIDGACTGKSVDVGSDGTAFISVTTTEDDGFFAIHVGSKL